MSKDEHDISWALELLTPRSSYTNPVTTNYWFEGMGIVSGFVVPCMANALREKRLLVGIHAHILGMVIGFFAGHYIKKGYRYTFSEVESIMRDYVRQHPEQFPPPERKKNSEILEKWTPIR